MEDAHPLASCPRPAPQQRTHAIESWRPFSITKWLTAPITAPGWMEPSAHFSEKPGPAIVLSAATVKSLTRSYRVRELQGSGRNKRQAADGQADAEGGRTKEQYHAPHGR